MKQYAGSWLALADQIKSEIADKAPLVAHAYNELVRNGMDPGNAATVCPFWVNTIVDRLIEEMEEEEE